MSGLKANQQEGVYEPTPEDIERIKMPQDKFLLSGDGVFHTIQGEGKTMGEPATFIRLHHCNLKCTWCDAFYTWKQDTPEFYHEPFVCEDLEELIGQAQQEKQVESKALRLVFTGGEPLLQQNKIVDFLEQHKQYLAEIETNGTISPLPQLIRMSMAGRVQFNCSPKLPSSGNLESKAVRQQTLALLDKLELTTFKFVVSSEEDIEYVLNTFHFLSSDKIFFMPEGVSKEDNTAVYEQINSILIRKGLKTLPRLQNIMYDGAKRRV